ncbi:MAG: hypothetical protein RLZZ153_2290, partial [Pseudomonadota bacterium]
NGVATGGVSRVGTDCAAAEGGRNNQAGQQPCRSQGQVGSKVVNSPAT